MILNVKTGTGFKGVLSYVEKEQAKNLRPEQKPEILHEQNIYGTAKEKAQQMRFVAETNQLASRPVLHVSVGFGKGEKLTPQKRDEVLNDVIKELGATPENNQFQIVKHNDTDLEHYHIVINKVGFDGPNTNTSYIQNKCHVIADKLEQKHDLERVKGRKIVYDPSNEKGYRFTTQAERKPQEQKKRASKVRDKVQDIENKKNYIKSNLSLALEDKSITNADDLQKALEQKNIKTNCNFNKNGLSGMSFRYEEIAVKGSEIQHKANYIASKLEENKAIQIQSTTQAPKAERTPKPTKEEKYMKQFKHLFEQQELAKPNQIPGAKSTPGPTTKVEPKAIRPISDFDFTIKSKGEEYGFVGYSKDFKSFSLQTKEGKILDIKNDKDYTFSKRPSENLNSIQLDLLNKGKRLVIEDETPYKIHKSKTNESILFSNLTEDECIKRGLNTVDTFTSQDIKNDFDDPSISDVDKKKRNVIPRRRL